MPSFPNIKYIGTYSKEVRSRENDDIFITFNKEYEYFEYDETPHKNFIKGCEKMVRTSDDYKIFENWVVNILGINYCQIQPNIKASDATLEMHHGPLFTLYNYCDIVLNKFLKLGKDINTFNIADEVIQLHFDGYVQVIMAAITNHEGIHNRDIIINVKQGIGDINKFIRDYKEYFPDEYKHRIYNYIALSKKLDSFDYGILDTDTIEPLLFDFENM